MVQLLTASICPTLCPTQKVTCSHPDALCLDLVITNVLVINKTDLAPMVGADLSVMARDSEHIRQGGKFLFTNLMTLEGLDAVMEWIKHDVLFEGL